MTKHGLAGYYCGIGTDIGYEYLYLSVGERGRMFL